MVQLDEVLKKRLQNCVDLPSPPTVATRIIELSNDAASDLDTLAKIVSFDPGLSAKILAIANSSMYMRRTRLDTLEQAVVLFGWIGTLNIALSCSLINNVRQEASDGIDHDYFWRRVLVAAVATRSMANLLALPNQQQLFLSALLQDIGVLAIERAFPEIYANQGDDQFNHGWLVRKEEMELGVAHPAVGAWLLHSWKLPGRVCRLVEHSHNQKMLEHMGEADCTAHACMVLGGELADCLYAGSNDYDYTGLAEKFNKYAGIGLTDLVNLVTEVANQFDEIATLFHMSPANAMQFESAVYVFHRLREQADDAVSLSR